MPVLSSNTLAPAIIIPAAKEAEELRAKTPTIATHFDSVRISLTAACNLTCTYCVPDRQRLKALPDELGAEEFLTALRLFRALGINKVRFTGGEVFSSKALSQVLEGLPSLGFSDVSLTTNGTALSAWTERLLKAGITRINVSLDTLDAEQFYDITGKEHLHHTLNGIKAAIDANIQVKVNCVLLNRQSAQGRLDLLRWCLDCGIELRFIELMRMGHLLAEKDWDSDFLSMAQLVEELRSEYDIEHLNRPVGATARMFAVKHKERHTQLGQIGVIANHSQPFCTDCKRLRLTANGHIFGCITASNGYDIRSLLSMPQHDTLTQLHALLLQARGQKRPVFTGGVMPMRILGG